MTVGKKTIQKLSQEKNTVTKSAIEKVQEAVKTEGDKEDVPSLSSNTGITCELPYYLL